jgi:hypothetical protein
MHILKAYATTGELVEFRRFTLWMPKSAQCGIQVIGHKKQNIWFGRFREDRKRQKQRKRDQKREIIHEKDK